MWETRSVQLSVRLPRDIAAQAEEVQQTDPDFLSRVVLYGLTRRSIYRHLRESEPTSDTAPMGDSTSEQPRTHS
jgi:hypothetical protein